MKIENNQYTLKEEEEWEGKKYKREVSDKPLNEKLLDIQKQIQDVEIMTRNLE